jgi:O-antigen ligase
MIEEASKGQRYTDRTIAFLGGMLPAAMVLGVVIFEFFIAISGLVWLVSRVKYPVRFDSHLIKHWVFWPLIYWFLAVMLSRIANGGTAFHFLHDLTFLRYPLFVMAMVDVAGRIPVHRYLIGGLMAGIAYALLNLLSAHIIGYDFVGKPLERYIGKLKEGARIGAMCAYAAPFFLLWGTFNRFREKKQRIWVLAIGCIALLLLVSSRIRTALLATLIGLMGGVIWQLLTRKKLKKRIIAAMVLLAGLGAAAVLWMQPNLDSMYARVYIWKVTAEVWLQNPVFGVGISSFQDAHRQIVESGIVPPVVLPDGESYQRVGHHAHNIVLQLMACNGLLGLGVFGWLFWRVVKSIRKSIESWQSGLWPWPFICLAIGLTGWNIYDPAYTTIVFYFLSLICVSEAVSRRPQKEDTG